MCVKELSKWKQGGGVDFGHELTEGQESEMVTEKKWNDFDCLYARKQPTTSFSSR